MTCGYLFVNIRILVQVRFYVSGCTLMGYSLFDGVDPNRKQYHNDIIYMYMYLTDKSCFT